MPPMLLCCFSYQHKKVVFSSSLHFLFAIPQKAVLGSSIYSEITLFCMSVQQPSDDNNLVITDLF